MNSSITNYRDKMIKFITYLDNCVPSTSHHIALTDGELKAMHEIMYEENEEVT
jgi:hypothetical protein